MRGKVHGIAHQVKPDGGSWGAPDDDEALEKNADGPLPRFHPSPVPDTPRRLVPRRLASERESRGKRHEKTLLTLLTLCEAHSFAV